MLHSAICQIHLRSTSFQYFLRHRTVDEHRQATPPPPSRTTTTSSAATSSSLPSRTTSSSIVSVSFSQSYKTQIVRPLNSFWEEIRFCRTVLCNYDLHLLCALTLCLALRMKFDSHSDGLRLAKRTESEAESSSSFLPLPGEWNLSLIHI